MDSQPLPSAPSGYGSSTRRDDGEKRAFNQPSWERSASGVGGRGGGFGEESRLIKRFTGNGLTGPDDRPQYAMREQLPLPSKPPYTAHLGNLAYDVTQVDIEGFLSDCQVTSVRIVEDKVDRKPKGFGYVEFGSLDGLKKALTLTESNFMGRNIKISVAEPPKSSESSRDLSDWSRKGPLPEAPQMNSRQPSSRGYQRNNFDNMSDAGSERGGSRRPGFFEGDGKVRDLGNWERRGPLSPAPGAGPPVRDGGRLREGAPPRERMQSPAWGEGRSDAGSRPPRKEFEARPPVERTPTAAEQDSQWRSKMRPDPSPAATPDVSTPTSPAPAQAPKERPRLNLAKRTVSTAETDAAANSTDSKASPFGAARPIDTAQREREVEEKRELAVRQKKEADDKAAEEKKARDSAARAERADRSQTQDEDKVTSPTGNAPRGPRRPSRQQNGSKGPAKENGEGPPQARPSFSILNRENDEGEEDAASKEAQEGEADAVDASANGDIIGDKETKPQEVTVVKDAAEGGQSTAQAMEDDGWSTVAGKSKSKGRGGARAMAS
nr:putative rna-binding protein sce3 [Quercus suber]